MFAIYGIYAVCVLLLLFFIVYRIERYQHEQRLKTIHIRIWVNGSRGKSSVTRLIAAGLRAQKQTVIAKTTGTSPRFIIDNTREEPILRLGMANIREQIKIVKKACTYNPEVLVFECMALRPDLQRIESRHIMQPTIAVVTNVRSDHLDVMGPSLTEVRKAYMKALPESCTVFTADGSFFQECKKRKNIDVKFVSKDSISDYVVNRFPYIEHHENIALALSVCTYCGISESDALNSMIDATPDPGALRSYSLMLQGKHISLVFAMAANDPESTKIIWNRIEKKESDYIYVLINCRRDRIDRSLQFADLLLEFSPIAGYFLTGEATQVLYKRLCQKLTKDTIFDLGGKSKDQAIERIASTTKDKSMVFAVGNTVGYGLQLIQRLVKRGSKTC